MDSRPHRSNVKGRQEGIRQVCTRAETSPAAGRLIGTTAPASSTRPCVRCLARAFLTLLLFWVPSGPVALPTEPVADHWFVDSLTKVFPEDQATEHAAAPPLLVTARNSLGDADHSGPYQPR
jgi:hypothetical protein